MNNNNQIIVYGGTGFYGRKVVERLVEKGQSVKVVTRNTEKAKRLFGDKVRLFQGDVTEQGIIEKSLQDVGAMKCGSQCKPKYFSRRCRGDKRTNSFAQ